MGSIGGEEMIKWEKMQGLCGRDEKILVLVRLRPLNEKEITDNEVADWECINDTTILYRNSLREGSTFPSAYTFGKLTSLVPSHWQVSVPTKSEFLVLLCGFE